MKPAETADGSCVPPSARRSAASNRVDPAKVEASFKNGVLTVTLPKTPETHKKEKRIEIKQG